MSFKYLFNIGYNKNILLQSIPQDVSRVINGAPVNNYLSGLITPDFLGLSEQQDEESYITQNDDLRTVPGTGPNLTSMENQASEISSNMNVAQDLGFDPNKGREDLYSKQLRTYLAEVFGRKGFNESGKMGFNSRRYKKALKYFDEQFEKDWKAAEETRRNEYMAKQREPLLAQTTVLNNQAILKKEQNNVTFSGFNGNMLHWGNHLQKVFNDNKDSEVWKLMAGDDSEISLEEFKTWQRNNGLSLVDGKIGRLTLQAMGFNSKNYNWLKFIPNNIDRLNWNNFQNTINNTINNTSRVIQNVTSTPLFSILNTQDRTKEITEEAKLKEGERLYGKNNYTIDDYGNIELKKLSVKGNTMYADGIPIKSITVNDETMPIGYYVTNGRVHAKSKNGDIYTVDSSTGRIYKVGDTGEYIKDAYYSFKLGGNINKFNQGGNMNQQQELQFALMGYVVATKKLPKDDKEINTIVQLLMQLKQQDPKQYNQLVQVGQQAYNQMNDQKNALLAERGAKLNYIRRLKGLCPDGLETYFFKEGGSIKSGCKPCMAKAQKGQELKKKGNAIDQFKNRHINPNDTVWVDGDKNKARTLTDDRDRPIVKGMKPYSAAEYQKDMAKGKKGDKAAARRVEKQNEKTMYACGGKSKKKK